jgi:hypothetical protein
MKRIRQFAELTPRERSLLYVPAILDAIEQALGENATPAGRVRKPN